MLLTIITSSELFLSISVSLFLAISYSPLDSQVKALNKILY